MAVVVVVMSVAQGLLLSTDVGQEALLDRQIASMEAFGITVSDPMYDQMEARLPYARYTTAAFLAVSVPLGTLVTAGLLFGVFTMLLDGAGSFKQVYALVAHSGVILALQQAYSAPISYARGEFAGADLGVFVPMLDETNVVALFLGTIDLFAVWSAISVAIGLGVLYKRKAGGIAASLIGTYVLIALVVAFMRSGS